MTFPNVCILNYIKFKLLAMQAKSFFIIVWRDTKDRNTKFELHTSFNSEFEKIGAMFFGHFLGHALEMKTIYYLTPFLNKSAI